MRYRLVEEQNGDHRYSFWFVQRYHWLIGWQNVKHVDAVSTNETTARNLFERVKKGQPLTYCKVVEEIVCNQ